MRFKCASSGCCVQGRAASEVDTADELLVAELMFNGVFRLLNKHQLAALVSCLVPVEQSAVRMHAQAATASAVPAFASVCSDKWMTMHMLDLQEEIKLSKELSAPLSALQDAARHIAAVSNECKLEVDAGKDDWRALAALDMRVEIPSCINACCCLQTHTCRGLGLC